MNKYLSEIEIAASNFFGAAEVRLFVDETRGFVAAANSHLKRSVLSNYGKVAVMLMPQNVIEEFSLPLCEYNKIAGVCVINFPYELDEYFGFDDCSRRRELIHKLICDALESAPSDVGLDKQAAIKLLQAALADLQSQ